MFPLVRPDYLREAPAWFYPRILVGAGDMLTPAFCHRNQITHVINCAFPEDSPVWFRRAFPNEYVCLEAWDSPHVSILSWYSKFDTMLSRFLREPGSRTVFVHCQCGINRSAFLTLTYICDHYGFAYNDVYTQLKRVRPCMFTNTVFRKQTEEFINGRLQGEKK